MILLSDCVAQVESSGNALAMRYEPSAPSVPASTALLVQKYADGGYMNMNTAQMVANTSWGKYQIMGYNLYATLGTRKTLVEFLNDPGYQHLMFQELIKEMGFSDGPFALMSEQALLKFARLYNGSEVYAQSLKTAYDGLLRLS